MPAAQAKVQASNNPSNRGNRGGTKPNETNITGKNMGLSKVEEAKNPAVGNQVDSKHHLPTANFVLNQHQVSKHKSETNVVHH